jgi:hypothetical protein
MEADSMKMLKVGQREWHYPKMKDQEELVDIGKEEESVKDLNLTFYANQSTPMMLPCCT